MTMKLIIKDWYKILSNDRGVALMMIITSIVILTALYGEFTFESKISRIKTTNILDKSQAKLLSESGLQMAMARLRLYKEAYNKVQANKQAKDFVSAQLLNQLWEVPYIYPIPITANASNVFKSSVDKFQEESLIEGEIKVNIQNISNRLNINLLRIDLSKINPNEDQNEISSQIDIGLVQDRSSTITIAQTIYNMLRINIENKKSKDEFFGERADNFNYQNMISSLKYYISDSQSLTQDPFSAEAEDEFQKLGVTPKFGPLASTTELHSIPGWNDEIIDLVQNEFSAHPSSQIDINKMTPTLLKVLLPIMGSNEEYIQDFYAYKDDPENPKFFNSTEDLKQYIVDVARLMNSTEFDERIKLFNSKGITFGPNPNFFKIISEGIYNRSTYTLIAFVTLPVQNTPNSPTTNPNSTNTNSNNEETDNSNTTSRNSNSNNNVANQNTQLLEPRIIEIQVN